jgi:hypothetical protein
MDYVQQDDGVPEEVRSLIGEIETVCLESPSEDVINALWLMFIRAIMDAEECSALEAVEQVRNNLDKIIAIHSPRH